MLFNLKGYCQTNFLTKPYGYNPYVTQIPNPQLQAYINANNKGIGRQSFMNYMNYAVEQYNHGNYSGFITQSTYALETGYSYPELYYYRGVAFEQLGNKRSAKKNYKKAYKQGVYEAKTALINLKKRK
jgi:hypothetical protein